MSNPVLINAVFGFRYILGSQILVLLLGISKAFLIPIFLGIENYGYWQIYVFYTTYVGLFGLGFNDGMYLRYGGYEYASLPLKTIRPSVWLYTVALIIAAAMVVLLYSFDPNPNRSIVMYLVATNIVVMGLLAIFSQTLQATNQLKRFGIFNAADKVFFLLLLPPMMIFKIDSFLYLAGLDLASKLFVLIYMLKVHKELLIGARVKFNIAFRETFDNIKAGSQLMIANISGMLVLGAGRFVIEHFDTLENYAYYSFGVSMTNLALVAITALSIVIYPTLKRLPEANYLHYYNKTNLHLCAFNILMLSAYFPILYIIELLLPKYTPVIAYLNVLFAITALQGKMQLLNNTYYKALRRESAMLSANLFSLVIVAMLSFVGYALTRSISSIAYAALLTMIYRVYSSELYLRRRMGGKGFGIIPQELLALIVFLTATSLLSANQALAVYVALLSISFLFLRDILTSLIKFAIGRVL